MWPAIVGLLSLSIIVFFFGMISRRGKYLSTDRTVAATKLCTGVSINELEELGEGWLRRYLDSRADY